MQSATLRVAAPASISPLVGVRARWMDLAPLLVPCALLVIGALIGYPFTLDAPVARERLLGLVLASVLAALALVTLKRVSRVAPLLVGVSLVSLLAGVWIIAATGPDVFRGTVGSLLQAVFRPVFYAARVTDPVEVTNTRFIVGYNGLADLCLVAIFCCAGAFFDSSRNARIALALLVGVSFVVLVGTGARGALTGLAAGICAVGIVLWPRRLALLAVVAAPLALLVAAVGVLDKGLEFSSTVGRVTYWSDLARLLVEYPLTGVGLGLDTAFRATQTYQINPDPERIFYAHNTFVQAYLEMGPLGMLGMLAIPVLALAAGLIARGHGIVSRPLLVAGLGIVAAMQAHGLTDQVVTTNVGTLIVLVGLAAVLAGVSPSGLAVVNRVTRVYLLACAALVAIALVVLVSWPTARAQALLDLGSLQLNQALALDRQSAARPNALAVAQSTLQAGLGQDPTHPAILRELGRLDSASFDDAAAMAAASKLAQSPRLDAFDMLQVAQLYRDLGFSDEAYAWAARAYDAWGRPPELGVMQVYAQSTLTDSRAQNLADQAEAAMRARRFGEARDLFQQALMFQPGSAYLTDREGAADRAVAKYGP